MAKVTKDIKHYEVYILRRNWATKRKDTSDLVRMQEIAIFDDLSLAEAHKSAVESNPAKDKDVVSESFEIQTSLVELEPAQENFSLPFNPEYSVENTKPKVERVKKVFTPKQK